MLWVEGIIVVVLVQLLAFSLMVGRARGLYGVKAPATTGHEMFERYNRAHLNSLEQVVLFLPAIVLFSQFWDPRIAAALGAVYVIGRQLYFMGYVRAPEKRGPGFGVGALAMLVLIGGSALGVILGLVRG